jgi:energy-coupling factor transporter ATP-binding protein EcfA2
MQTVVRRDKVGTVPVKILDGVSGVLRPGRLTLLMGPPGAGKSVFMKVRSRRCAQSSSSIAPHVFCLPFSTLTLFVNHCLAVQALGGRLRPGADLRESGTVRYNGLSTDEFCVERAIGLVDQYDDRKLCSAPQILLASRFGLRHQHIAACRRCILTAHCDCASADLPSLTVRETLEFARYGL